MTIIFQEEIVRYKKQYEEMLTERNKFKQQCTQVWSGITTHYHHNTTHYHHNDIMSTGANNLIILPHFVLLSKIWLKRILVSSAKHWTKFCYHTWLDFYWGVSFAYMPISNLLLTFGCVLCLFVIYFWLLNKCLEREILLHWVIRSEHTKDKVKRSNNNLIASLWTKSCWPGGSG